MNIVINCQKLTTFVELGRNHQVQQFMLQERFAGRFERRLVTLAKRQAVSGKCYNM